MPYRSLFSRYSTLSRYTPHTGPYRIDICLYAKQVRGGVSHVKLPSERYRGIGGYSSYSIAISRYTAPLRLPATKTAAGKEVKVFFDFFCRPAEVVYKTLFTTSVKDMMKPWDVQ